MQDKYKIGDSIVWTKMFGYADVEKFAQISGDRNPVHLSAEYARNTPFGKPIVHGMLVASLFSAIIANELPGNGSIYLHQSLDFKSPVFHDQNVLIKVEILSIRKDKPIYELKTICTDTEGKVLIEGKAIVIKK